MPRRNEVIENLNRWVNNLDSRLNFIVQVNAAVAEEHMKMNAPWTDRTGNARASLHASFADIRTRGVGGSSAKVLILTGGMWYSPLLELKNGGRQAIIWPTAQMIAQRIMSDIRGMGVRL